MRAPRTIQEHYTDTGGATERVFGPCRLLGFRFERRLRDLATVSCRIRLPEMASAEVLDGLAPNCFRVRQTQAVNEQRVRGARRVWLTRSFSVRNGRSTLPLVWIESHRTLQGGAGFAPVPGNKLPGYHHLVPPGTAKSGERSSSPAKWDQHLRGCTGTSDDFSFGWHLAHTH